MKNEVNDNAIALHESLFSIKTHLMATTDRARDERSNMVAERFNLGNFKSTVNGVYTRTRRQEN
jgi:hypothetical protein